MTLTSPNYHVCSLELMNNCSSTNQGKAGASCVTGRRVEEKHLLVGSVFEVWNDVEKICPPDPEGRNKSTTINVCRMCTVGEDGEEGRTVGLAVPEHAIEKVITTLKEKQSSDSPIAPALIDREENAPVVPELLEELKVSIAELMKTKAARAAERDSMMDQDDEKDDDLEDDDDDDSEDDEDEDIKPKKTGKGRKTSGSKSNTTSDEDDTMTTSRRSRRASSRSGRRARRQTPSKKGRGGTPRSAQPPQLK